MKLLNGLIGWRADKQETVTTEAKLLRVAK
ncbi:hypothetical protein Egran_06259, partial [Elaphomyces granulatus]